MSPLVKIQRSLLLAALDDLERPHPFAFERLGFISFRQSLGGNRPILLCYEYHSIPDEQYVEDKNCGGRIGGTAIQAAMGRSFRNLAGQIWVHSHGRLGVPAGSPTDYREGPRVVQSCANAQPKSIHAWAVISEHGIAGQMQSLDGQLHELADFSVVGWPMAIPMRTPVRRREDSDKITFSRRKKSREDRYDRQSFLGPEAQHIVARAKIGIVGLGGGGSHLNQQLAHIGFQNVVTCDEQHIDLTNLNRLVGGTTRDVMVKRKKAAIAARLFRGVQPKAEIEDRPARWEEKRSALRECDVILGAIDGFAARRDLEVFCRTHLIPLIDIGMTVLRPTEGPSEIRGQVVLSMPGELCMHCMRFLTTENLAEEAQDYNAGPQPQVVWPNGVLASTAIGYLVGLLTGWSGGSRPSCRVDYRGSQMTVTPSNLVAALKGCSCRHFPVGQVGDPVFKKL